MFSAIMTLLVMPVILFTVVILSHRTLNKKWVSTMIGACWEDIKVRRRRQRAFYLVFIVRRFIFIYVAMYQSEIVVFQIFQVFFIN